MKILAALPLLCTLCLADLAAAQEQAKSDAPPAAGQNRPCPPPGPPPEGKAPPPRDGDKPPPRDGNAPPPPPRDGKGPPPCPPPKDKRPPSKPADPDGADRTGTDK